MMYQPVDSESAYSSRMWLFICGAVAAFVAGLALLIGLILRIVTLTLPDTAFAWLAAFQDNWLVKIFNSHAQIAGAVTDLQGINPLDVTILVLTGLIAVSFMPAFRKAPRIWLIAASVLSVIGVSLYYATQLAGRSSVMLVVMILSVVMFTQKDLSEYAPFAGLIGGIFLLLGDFTVGFQSTRVTILFGLGYILLIIWYFLVAAIFARLQHS